MVCPWRFIRVLMVAFALLAGVRPLTAQCAGCSNIDVYTEVDLRQAMATGDIAPSITLHANITFAAPLEVKSLTVINTNGFDLTGPFVPNILSGGFLVKSGTTGSLTVATVPNPGPGFLFVYVDQGVLRILGPNAPAYVFLAPSSYTELPFNGATLKAASSFTLQSLSLSGTELFGPVRHREDETIDTNGFTVSITGGINGTGRLIKTGAGTLILEGDNLAERGVLVTGGVLRVDSDRRLGVLATDEIYHCDISPYDGPCYHLPPMVATLTLDGGTLQASASFNIARPVTLDARGGAFDTNGFTLGVGALNGSGGLTKLGSGTLVLNGPSTYTGPTMVNAGTLRIAAPGALPNGTALTMANGSTVDATSQSLNLGSLDGAGSLVIDRGSVTVGSNSASTSFVGSISGSGSLTKTGTGTLALGGSNTYSGGTVVHSGALIGTTEGLHGAIANNSLVGFSQNADGTFAGQIDGPGGVVKAGSGAVTFATPQSYTGLTAVAAGRLNVTGLAGSALVDRGATLSGTGTIAGSLTVNGMLTRSSSLTNPALTIGGNLILGPAATYVFQVADAHDNRLQVNGKTTIDNAQLTIAGLDATSARVTTLPLFTSIGGVSGQFGAVDASVPVDAIVTSRGSTAFAIVERTDIPFASLAPNANGHSAGGALDAARATASADLRSVIREVGALSDADVSSALAQLGGSTSAIALRRSAFDAQAVLRSVSDRIIDRRSNVRSDPGGSAIGVTARPTGVWFRASVSGLSGDATGADALSHGGLMGIDRAFAQGRWLVGAFGGYDRAALTLDASANAARDRRYRAGAYAATTFGTAYINAALAGTDHRFETTRHLAFVAQLDPQLGGGPVFGGFDRSTAARYAGHDVTTFVESGLRLTRGPALVQPFAGLDASHVSADGFVEHGAGAVDLIASDASTTSVRAAGGIRVTRSGAASSATWAPRVEVRYLHELADRVALVPVAFADAPMSGFTVTSPTAGAHAVAASAGFIVGLSGRLLLTADYRGVFAPGDHTHALTLGMAF